METLEHPLEGGPERQGVGERAWSGVTKQRCKGDARFWPHPDTEF